MFEDLAVLVAKQKRNGTSRIRAPRAGDRFQTRKFQNKYKRKYGTMRMAAR